MSDTLAAEPRRGSVSMPARGRTSRHRHNSPAASGGSINRRRQLLARTLHGNSSSRNSSSGSLTLPQEPVADDAQVVPGGNSFLPDAPWLVLGSDEASGAKLGRSASFCGPAAAVRRSFMKRPSSCASEADCIKA
ncbi:hypothetical protein EV174_006475, partial [Coemansia sp. RSA 2320]